MRDDWKNILNNETRHLDVRSVFSSPEFPSYSSPANFSDGLMNSSKSTSSDSNEKGVRVRGTRSA